MPADVTFPLPAPHGPGEVTVRHRRLGAGSPLLLLHGIGHHWQAWEPVLPALAERHEVIAVDLPGFGASPALPPGVPYGVDAVVPVLGRLCAELGIERPHVAGNSLGGLLALGLGRAGLARSVTALAPAGFWTEAERRYAYTVLGGMRVGARVLPQAVVERLARSTAGRALLVSTIYARPARRDAAAAAAETGALRAATGFEPTLAAGRGLRFTGDLSALPVTVAWGTRDRILLRRQGVRALHELSDARLVRLPGCGHVPMSDDPELVARVILDTCAQVEEEAGRVSPSA
ncbi:alpha/beta fold hydrolase [Kitasatospora sp. RG8]|uniref:alpha/beta fold hydrolase n=1 Tax=Kitasatospora sp. RG8 TaxID=2820815 RepID=UPI001AE063DA|nr:alpha/beta fold hydrolase [Kitasatospora sp. RG8]MBP0452618.1 alpha/beta fold hydrolase [Kitasatospora sp. RG8]